MNASRYQNYVARALASGRPVPVGAARRGVGASTAAAVAVLSAATAVTTAVTALIAVPSAALAADTVFTVGNYPVDATARDAVAAKKQAHTRGQAAALRSLLKRLVPVAAYPQLRRLGKLKSDVFIDGIVVRSEQNSRTEYLASLDFSFRPKAVKDLLRRQGIPYLEQQAQPIIVVPIYKAPETGARPVPAAFSQTEGARQWLQVWRGLDLVHALTPIKLKPLKPEIHADTVTALLAGDTSAYRVFSSEYGEQYVVLAIAQPDISTNRLKLTMIGRDAVDFFTLQQRFRIQEDLLYTSELAAVIGLGVLEGRWKATMVKSAGASAGIDMALQPVRFVVTFSGAAQWRSLRTKIARTNGVEQMEVAGLSARGATVTLQYPGGVRQLAEGLGQAGLLLRQAGGGWLLQGN